MDVDRLARESDVLFVLAPGGAATRHVINEDFLRKMKKTSILVNPSRGTLVDSDALAKALREDWIWGAGVDVVEGEPNVRADHPLVKEPRYVFPFEKCHSGFYVRAGLDASSFHISVPRRSKPDSAWLRSQPRTSSQASLTKSSLLN